MPRCDATGNIIYVDETQPEAALRMAIPMSYEYLRRTCHFFLPKLRRGIQQRCSWQARKGPKLEKCTPV